MVLVQGQKGDDVGRPPGSFLPSSQRSSLRDSGPALCSPGGLDEGESFEFPLKKCDFNKDCVRHCRILSGRFNEWLSNAAALDSFAKSSPEVMSCGENSLMGLNV